MKIQEIEMSARSRNALACAGINTLEYLALFNPDDLMRRPNFGRKSIRELEQILANHGLSFAYEKPLKRRKTRLPAGVIRNLPWRLFAHVNETQIR